MIGFKIVLTKNISIEKNKFLPAKKLIKKESSYKNIFNSRANINVCNLMY